MSDQLEVTFNKEEISQLSFHEMKAIRDFAIEQMAYCDAEYKEEYESDKPDKANLELLENQYAYFEGIEEFLNELLHGKINHLFVKEAQ